MANAGCINAYDCNGCLIQTLQNLDSACIGVGVQYTAPNPLDDKRLDYIKYTDKCGCVQCLSAENEILIYATNGVIKNLTLTNDDVNEAIKIQWNDVFGSNRAKTIVRYKTGSYPVSITDGTLAVEETTKNQYSSTPFSLSGVLDETTYYITAFAVDSNNTVISSQTASVTTDFGWHPSANTLLYLPLNGDAIDGSGNSRNGTLPNSSYYSREYIKGNSGRKCRRGKSSSLTTPCISGIYNSSELGNSPRTISVWMKFDNLGNLDEQVSPFWIGTANGGNQGGWFGLFCLKTSSYNSTLGILRYYSDPACNYNNYDTNWHNIIITYDDTNKAKAYVDGVQVTMTLNATVSFNTIGTNYYIGAGRTGDTGKLIRYSEFIIENKVWNQIDIQKYYNQTKSIYS